MTDETNQASFASILAGVKRMREQYDGEGSQERSNPAPQAQPPQVEAQAKPVDRQEPLFVPASSVSRTVTAPQASASNASAPHAPAPNALASNAPKPSATTFNISRSTTPTPSSTSSRGASRGVAHMSYSSIQVSSSQKGNPLLSESQMKSTPWAFNSTILSDYYINPKLQILFLSLKYHKLHPEYIWQRLKKLNKGSTTASPVSDNVLRILLVVVDVDSHQEILRKLLDFCVKHDLTLILSWTFEEAGNYICFAKEHELSSQKQTSIIKGQQAEDYNSSIQAALTTIRAINKTDVSNLLGNLKSFDKIVTESSAIDSSNTLGKIHGLGRTKVDNMKQIFLEPFIYNKDYENI